MKRAFLIVGLLMGCIGSNYAQEAVTADEIIQRYIENCGVLSEKGQEEKGKYTAEWVQTTVDNKGDQLVLQVKMALDSKEKKFYFKTDCDEKKYRQAQAVNKDEGWHYFNRQVAVKFKEEEIAKLWLQDYPLVDLPSILTDSYAVKRELGGEKEIEGKMCHSVIITPKTGATPPTTFYFDKTSGMLMRMENEQMTITYQNYVTFGSLKICTLSEINYPEKISEVTKVKSARKKIQSIQLGTPDESLFTKEAVKNAFKK